MRFIKHILQYTFFLLICSNNLFAQQNYKFRTLSPKGGFYYDGVKEITFDKNGFVWILMDNDLLRFDGYEYKHYYSQFKELNDSAKWTLLNISADTTGHVLINTNNGLYRLSAYSKPEAMGYKNVHSVTVDHQNHVWFMHSKELHRLNLADNTISKPLFEGKTIQNISYYSSYNKGLYMATSLNRIYHYDYKIPDRVSLFHAFPEDHAIIGLQKRWDKLWVLVKEKGLFVFDLTTGEIIDWAGTSLYNKNPLQTIKKMRVDKNGLVWIGTQEGLFVLNLAAKKHQMYVHSELDLLSPPNSSIWEIAEDKEGDLWIGTFSGGLCIVNLEEGNQFKTYTPKNSALSNELVSSFAEDKQYLWVGTDGGGINRINKENNSFFHYKYSSDRNSISHNNIKSLVMDSHDRLWIALFRGGLNYLDTKTGKIRVFPVSKENTNTGLINNDLRKIVLEGDSGLWIAYQTGDIVISYLSFKDMSYTHYHYDGQDNSQYVFDICAGSNNDLWVLTRENLYHLLPSSGKINRIELPKHYYLGGQTLCLDRHDNLWIGTVGNGFLKYDTRNNELIKLDEILQYSTFAIHSICNIDDKFLWLGTNNGLFRYDVKQNSYLRFDENDGLQGQVYYPLACKEGKDNLLYFGGSNGFSVINQEHININQEKPKAIITGLFVDNEEMTSLLADDNNLSDARKITLNHRQPNFGFRFSSDSYLIPEKNTFKYRLKGYDNRWIMSTADNRAVFYNKVPAGTYYFEVMAANNDGVWSEMATIIEIKRLPSPWLSWYAYLIYSLLLIAISALIIYYYLDKKKLKMKLYFDKLEKEKKDEIHQSQLRFFTNISHDFRTPLSLILATVDNLKKEGVDETLYRILNSNAQRLLNLVNELMDFRKVENQKLPLQVQALDVNRLIDNLSFDFREYAQKRNISFDVVPDNQLPNPLCIDKKVFEKIFMNLLNNAFKYTRDGGRITVESHIGRKSFSSLYQYSYTVSETPETENVFLIVFRDTGVGITEQSIATVFERFYKVDTNNTDGHLGTGIGLALVKSLVLLHKGSITLYSEWGKGSDIVVCLPADPAIYEASEFLSAEESQQDTTNQVVGDKVVLQTISDKAEMKDLLFREKKRILLVEDNCDLRSLIANFLSQHYEIVEANDGEMATSILEETEVDLILSDIMMPNKDGITLCREVKNDINTSHIPVVLLTAKTELESKLEGADSGADLYFEKPVDFNLLQRSIHNLFKHQQQLKEYYAKNYFSEDSELSSNEHDNRFLKKLIQIVDDSLTQANVDVNYLAGELSMSRSKLYAKLKALTGKSIVEFILNYRLRKAARLIIEEDLSAGQVMEMVGIKSQSYFTSVFKKEFGETPAVFAAKNKKKNG